MKKKEKEKLIIYQAFPRILTNNNATCAIGGTYKQNGSGKLAEISTRLLDSLKDLGVNALWLTGVIEHATKTAFPEAGVPADNPYVVKGEAGSPYAIKDYYDVAPALAVDPEKRREEFGELVARVHESGLKLILDFVPNHTARQYHSDCAPEGATDFGANDDSTWYFRSENNYYYITNQQFSPSIPLGDGDDAYIEFPAKATGNDCFNAFPSATDWFETVKLNYGHDYGDGSDHFEPIPSTWRMMVDILKHWASLGVDGFRCDMVFMVPLAFWHWAIAEVKRDYPEVFFIGEIYDIGLYRPFVDYGGFDYLYDKVGLYDTLVGIETMNYSTARLTGCWQAVEGLGARMLNFLENHDEVRYASDVYGQTPATVIPALVVSSMFSTGPFMIYYGQELGERGEEDEGYAGHNHRTTIFDYWSLATLRRWNNEGKWDEQALSQQERWLRRVYRKVLRLCNEAEAIRKGAFFDLMYVNLSNPGFDPHREFAFLRHTEKQKLLILANFSDSDRVSEIVIPQAAFEAAGLPTGNVKATDLLTGEPQQLELQPDQGTKVAVKRRCAVVLELMIRE